MDELLGQNLALSGQKSLLTLLVARLFPFILGTFCFLFAWYLLGFVNLNFPLDYSGDAIFMSWFIKRLIEGVWYFNNTYSGFPFGSTFLDFPSSDVGSFFILKLLSISTHNFVLAQNLYFLLGFSVDSSISFIVLRKIGINKFYAITGAMLFTFLPFHFLRFQHLFYTWYFHVPIFVWFALQLFSINPPFFFSKRKIWKTSLVSLSLLFLACFGVYFVFFAAIMFIAAGIAGSLKWKSHKNIVAAGLAVGIITTGVAINIAPNILYIAKNGHNLEVAIRSPFESELYGLKLTQMLLPRSGHRSHLFSKINSLYSNFPLNNENTTSTLGFIGSIGLIILLGVAIGSPFFRFPLDSSVQLLAFITIFLYLFATIGGFSSIFAMFVSPMIRAWNRASIFFAFISITSFLLCAEKLLRKIINVKFLPTVLLFSAIFLVGFGIWDETTVTNFDFLNQQKNKFLSDQHFVKEIEQIIPGGAIYQLPYMPFPEGAWLYNLDSYGLFYGYLHSSTLHWSFGGTRGRAGDLFFKQLATQTPAQQLSAIKRLGFKGIYIDRRGYQDYGQNIEREFTEILGKKALVSEDNQLAFFSI